MEHERVTRFTDEAEYDRIRSRLIFDNPYMFIETYVYTDEDTIDRQFDPQKRVDKDVRMSIVDEILGWTIGEKRPSSARECKQILENFDEIHERRVNEVVSEMTEGMFIKR